MEHLLQNFETVHYTGILNCAASREKFELFKWLNAVDAGIELETIKWKSSVSTTVSSFTSIEQSQEIKDH